MVCALALHAAADAPQPAGRHQPRALDRAEVTAAPRALADLPLEISAAGKAEVSHAYIARVYVAACRQVSLKLNGQRAAAPLVTPVFVLRLGAPAALDFQPLEVAPGRAVLRFTLTQPQFDDLVFAQTVAMAALMSQARLDEIGGMAVAAVKIARLTVDAEELLRPEGKGAKP